MPPDRSRLAPPFRRIVSTHNSGSALLPAPIARPKAKRIRSYASIPLPRGIPCQSNILRTAPCERLANAPLETRDLSESQTDTEISRLTQKATPTLTKATSMKDGTDAAPLSLH